MADDPVERPVDHLLAPLVELAQELAEPVKPVGDLRVVLVVACRGDEVGERHLLGWERRTDPALESTFGPDPAAELPLRRKRGDGRVTGEEIRSLVEQLKGIVGVLQNAHPEERRAVYQGVNVSIRYHTDGRLHVKAGPSACTNECVGGGT